MKSDGAPSIPAGQNRHRRSAIPNPKPFLLSLPFCAPSGGGQSGRRGAAPPRPSPPLPTAVRSNAARTWPQPCHRPMASDPSSFPLSFPPTSGGGHGWPGKEVAALPRLSRRRARSPDGERAAVERAGDSALSSEPATHTSDVPTAGGGGSSGYRAPASRRSVLSHAAPQRPR